MSDQQADQSAATSGSPDPGKFAIDAVDTALEALKSATKGSSSGETKTTPAAIPPIPTTAAGDPPKAPKPDASETKAAAPEPIRVEPRRSQDVLTLAPAERGWHRPENDFTGAETAPKDTAVRGPRFAAIAAMLALAVIAGAAGGAFATLGVSQGKSAAPDLSALQASVVRIDNEIAALKSGLEQTASASLGQLNKSSDRLERIEKAQADTAAKLAKLGEGVDKLRVAAAPKEVTGSVQPPAQAAAAQPQPAAAPQQVAAAPAAAPANRLPTVEGWVLRDARQGTALIEGRTGLYQVYAGDPVPGLGRVDAIRKQDGRWVVVTSRGLIVAR